MNSQDRYSRNLRWNTMFELLALVTALLAAVGNASECAQRTYDDGIVCVCNATYCDEYVDPVPAVPPEGIYYQYVSSKAGLRLQFTKGKFAAPDDEPSPTDATITLDCETTFQKITGFGGAFTDAAGINIKKLSVQAQHKLLRSYFDPNTGSRYAFGRVPIAGSDFSTRPYTYDDVSGDERLEHFHLALEDYDYKLPLMQEALKLNPNLKFFAVAWSAPGWMKTNNNITGFGFLKPEHYQTYTNYIVKFLEKCERYGFKIWCVSTGNEPMDVFVPTIKFNKMGWLPEALGKFVADHLGPTLARSRHKDTKIMLLDDQRLNVPWYVDRVFVNKKAKNYISIIAVHWYLDKFVSPKHLDEVQEKYPDQQLLMTEACIVPGSAEGDVEPVVLGSWARGERYVVNIIENLSHWVTGWVDWNLALDITGGPNWVKNFVDAAIIVLPENDEFVKQPMYYAISHFARYVKPDSKRCKISDTSDVKTVAFVTPDDGIVTVLYNSRDSNISVALDDMHRGTIYLDLPPKSIHTVIHHK